MCFLCICISICICIISHFTRTGELAGWHGQGKSALWGGSCKQFLGACTGWRIFVQYTWTLDTCPKRNISDNMFNFSRIEKNEQQIILKKKYPENAMCSLNPVHCLRSYTICLKTLIITMGKPSFAIVTCIVIDIWYPPDDIGIGHLIWGVSPRNWPWYYKG